MFFLNVINALFGKANISHRTMLLLIARPPYSGEQHDDADAMTPSGGPELPVAARQGIARCPQIIAVYSDRYLLQKQDPHTGTLFFTDFFWAMRRISLELRDLELRIKSGGVTRH